MTPSASTRGSLIGCAATEGGTVAESDMGRGACRPHGCSPPVAAAEDPNAVYALGSSSGESARLQRQAEELAPDSVVLLDWVGVRSGDAAIDLGCGPRGVIDLLAERVAPGLSEVEVVCGDARHTGFESGSFDLVHARTLLITVPQPAAVLEEMVRLARPGGWVAGP